MKGAVLEKHPFLLKRRNVRKIEPFHVIFKVNFSEGCGCAYSRIKIPIDFQIGWLNTIREWQEEFVGSMSSKESVDTITKDLLGSRVFVFMPRGEVLMKRSSHQSGIRNMIRGIHVIDCHHFQLNDDVFNCNLKERMRNLRKC